jgi:hypothetical protein
MDSVVAEPRSSGKDEKLSWRYGKSLGVSERHKACLDDAAYFRHRRRDKIPAPRRFADTRSIVTRIRLDLEIKRGMACLAVSAARWRPHHIYLSLLTNRLRSFCEPASTFQTKKSQFAKPKKVSANNLVADLFGTDWGTSDKLRGLFPGSQVIEYETTRPVTPNGDRGNPIIIVVDSILGYVIRQLEGESRLRFVLVWWALFSSSLATSSSW